MSPSLPVRSRRSATRPRRTTDTHLPHWSEIPTEDRHRPSPRIAAILCDLVSWGAEIATRLTRHVPEDQEAIERVRRYAIAWLGGQPCQDVEIDDVLTTTAALMAGIDRSGIDRPIRSTPSDDDERHAIGAPVAA